MSIPPRPLGAGGSALPGMARRLSLMALIMCAITAETSLFAADDAEAEDAAALQALLQAGGAEAEVDGAAAAAPNFPQPHSAAEPAAYLIRWDKYRTLIVVDASAGLLRPAWIVTFSTVAEQLPNGTGQAIGKDQVVVAYRGQAFCDKEGVLHIDAHEAILTGVFTNGGWSPDSFDIDREHMVTTHDDDPSHPGNAGQVEKQIDARAQADEYRGLLYMAQAIVEGDI